MTTSSPNNYPTGPALPPETVSSEIDTTWGDRPARFTLHKLPIGSLAPDEYWAGVMKSTATLVALVTEGGLLTWSTDASDTRLLPDGERALGAITSYMKWNNETNASYRCMVLIANGEIPGAVYGTVRAASVICKSAGVDPEIPVSVHALHPHSPRSVQPVSTGTVQGLLRSDNRG